MGATDRQKSAGRAVRSKRATAAAGTGRRVIAPRARDAQVLGGGVHGEGATVSGRASSSVEGLAAGAIPAPAFESSAATPCDNLGGAHGPRGFSSAPLVRVGPGAAYEWQLSEAQAGHLSIGWFLGLICFIAAGLFVAAAVFASVLGR